MYYEESKKIFETLKKGNNFVIFCHEGPDMDSIISALLMHKLLKNMGKNVDLFCPEDIGDGNRFLDPDNNIKVVDPNSLDYSKYDVLLALDVNQLTRFGINKQINFNGSIVNIDHHEGKQIGKLNVFDRYAGATCAILYQLFKDWKCMPNADDLNKILLGIISDTGIFHFSIYQTSKIFRIVSELIDMGANYDQALYYVDQCNTIYTYQFWSEALKRIQIDNEYRFAYTVIPYDIFSKYKKYGVRSRQVSDLFLRNLDGTDFGIVIIEDEKNQAKISVRTRTPGFYVVDLVKDLGGGGHLTGGGATVIADSFEDALETVLKKAREFSEKKRNTI